MLKDHLEVHFGPTFSSYFENNFYRGHDDDDDDDGDDNHSVNDG
jgi:hypothetical protein